MCNRMARRAFTLVEILLVVVIIGILAAIVLPRFSSATDATRRASLSDQLQTLRVQIQFYMMQHGDTAPALNGTDWTPLTARGTYNGDPMGPYISDVPRNSLNNQTAVLVVNTNPHFGDAVNTPNIGFVYNSTNGFIWATNTAGNRIYNEADPNDPNN